jgi:8-oxo-dGTP pyrophosphatase MutT (NUDIX family)
MTRNELIDLLNVRPISESVGFNDDGDQPRPGPHVNLTRASVLIPVINRGHGSTVLFTQRTAHLNDHAGQISFPGGRAEQSDPDPAFTALSEAEEEVGLARSRVEVLGRIPEYRTGTGFLVTPVVGWVEAPVTFTPDPFEVADVFEVPFRFLMDPANHRVESAFFRGRMRTYYALSFEGRYIWGATAGMLVSLYRVLAGARGETIQGVGEAPKDSG